MRRAGFTFEWEGLQQFDSMLKSLPKAMSRTVIRNALKKAGKPLRAAASDAAPRGPTGNLQDSIIISTKLTKGQSRYKQRNAVEIFIGADHTKAPHAHLVEFGTKERLGQLQKSSGRMPENRFFTKAWDATRAQANKILAVEIEKELMKAAKRLAARATSGKLGKAATKALR